MTMNLKKLFIAQKELDEHIEKNHPRKEGEDRFGKLILALQVELAECAQESRCFKFWSSRQEPVTEDLRVVDYKESGEAILETYNPLLEEYVDCLHFTLSIGLHLYNENIATDLGGFRKTSIQDQFRTLFHYSTMLSGSYWHFFEYLIGLGEMLGFTWEQIEAAYFEKNAVNHRRQENGY
jgi:dimeric dUTPase (all-alpha-NTP-PPase superfamily)